MNFCNLDFDIVSDFDIRISSLCYINSTKDYVRNYKRFMQNKPNFQKAKMNVNSLITTDYENKWQRKVRKNKPNSNPISSKAKMNLKSLAKKSGHTHIFRLLLGGQIHLTKPGFKVKLGDVGSKYKLGIV